jgi:hypothetical protein
MLSIPHTNSIAANYAFYLLVLEAEIYDFAY